MTELPKIEQEKEQRNTKEIARDIMANFPPNGFEMEIDIAKINQEIDNTRESIGNMSFEQIETYFLLPMAMDSQKKIKETDIEELESLKDVLLKKCKEDIDNFLSVEKYFSAKIKGIDSPIKIDIKDNGSFHSLAGDFSGFVRRFFSGYSI